MKLKEGLYREQKCAENYNKQHNKFIILTAISILLISNRKNFRVLFEKNAYVYFNWKINLYFSIGNGLPRKPALCQLYRHSCVPYSWAWMLCKVSRSSCLYGCMTVCIYSALHKKRGSKLTAIILSNLNWFSFFFTGRLCSKLAINWLLKMSLHLAYVATLPCESKMPEKND